MKSRWIPALILCLAALSVEANVITDENAKTGTTDWQLYSRATTEIEGYASAASVAPGDSIRMYVNTSSATYTIEVFRMGWYGGKGGRRMTNAVTRNGVQQPMPQMDTTTGLVECNWTDPYVLTIPSDWVSGVYLAKLTAEPSRKNAYIIFVVRSAPERVAAYTAVTGDTKYQAYNPWGGKSLYGFNSSNGVPAVKVSYNRPYSPGSGGDEFLFRSEFNVVRFLEREGYDVTYLSDVDLQERGGELLKSAAYISIGHDEYWSWQMRDAVERARDFGVNLVFMSANSCYWQIRFEPSTVNGEPDRTIVAYKEKAQAQDPVLFDRDPTNDKFATTQWREAPVSRPEDQLIGTMYTYAFSSSIPGFDIVIGDTSHWIFDNTGLHSGDHLKGLLGYEVDRSTFTSYPGTIVLTHSPITHTDGTPDESNMTIYTAKSGALVFASGSIYWAWGLDDFNANAHPNSPSTTAAQQMMRNVLNRMSQRATPPPGPRRRAIGR